MPVRLTPPSTGASSEALSEEVDYNLIHRLLDQANEVILGKQETIKLALACLLARGHLLIEDIPGIGKIILAHLLAKLIGAINYAEPIRQWVLSFPFQLRFLFASHPDLMGKAPRPAFA